MYLVCTRYIVQSKIRIKFDAFVLACLCVFFVWIINKNGIFYIEKQCSCEISFDFDEFFK